MAYQTENREELLSITQILSTLIGEPEPLFVPISSFTVSNESLSFRVEATIKGKYQELQDTPSVPLSVRELCEVVRKVLENAVEAEAKLGQTLGSVALCFSPGFKEVKLSPLMTQREQPDYLVETLSQILGKGRAGRYHFPCLSDLMNQLKDRVRTEAAHTLVDWWPEACFSAAAASLPQLNEFVKSEEWATVEDLLDWTVALPLQFTMCMSRSCICSQESQALVWTCARHFYGSEQCRREADSSAECPLCATRRLVVVRPRIKEVQSTPTQQICPCGQEFSQRSGDWRLALLGSTQYESAAKCCSEACFVRFVPTQPATAPIEISELDPIEMPEFDPNLCVECKQPLRADGLLWRFPCQDHGFCSSSCHYSFHNGYSTSHNWIDLPCLFCTKELTKQIKGDQACYQPMLAQLETMQRAMLSFKTEKAAMDLASFRDEIKTLMYENKAPKDPRPLSLSLKKLREYSWLFACCVCKKPTIVHKRSNSAAFLVRCEFKVHCVCSPDCAGSLNEVCPLCPDAQLYPIPAPHKATQAVLRTVPASHCMCLQSSTYYDLPECCHSVCLQCIGNYLTEDYGDERWYECSICSEKYEKVLLMSQVFT